MEEEFKIFIESFEELVNDRINIAINKVSKSTNYKELYEKYSELYEKMTEKCTISEIENFSSSIYLVNDLENTYIYLQGLVDGILLIEHVK